MQHNLPVNPKIMPIPPGLVFLDPAKFIDEGDHWRQLYREIFINQAR